MPECWELGTCNFVSINPSPTDPKPLEVLLLPFDYIFGGLSIVILWGLVVGILWLRTQNPQLVGIIGIAMSGAYLAANPTHATEFDSARIIGGALLLLSCGISVYHIITSRLTAGPQ
jgi:hypothetical protein